jgi:hypothetical protein
MANSLIVKQVIDLFKKHPSFRDDRYETVEWILLKHYRNHYGHSIKADFRILTEIDRAFRLIQQDIPELRGKTWLARQRQGGELSAEEYEREKMMEDDILEAAKQLDLFPKNETFNY